MSNTTTIVEYEVQNSNDVLAKISEKLNVPLVAHHKDVQIDSLEQYLEHPLRVKQDQNFLDVESLIYYINEFKNDNSRLFYCETNKGLKFKSVLDYHEKASELTNDEIAPRWGGHRAFLDLKYDRDYAELKALDNREISQGDFALFIEGNIPLFKKPKGADMLELAQHVRGSIDGKFTSAKSLHNGETQIEWIETIKTTGVSKAGTDFLVPERVEFICPIYQGNQPQIIEAAFRYAVDKDEQKLSFKYRLLSKDAERDAADLAKERIEAETGLTAMKVEAV